MSEFELPEVPSNVPRFGNAFSRWFGRSILRILGWRVTGEIPNEKQVVLAGAPHTSNWDFIIAMSTMLAMGVKLSYLMKKEAFIWPFKGLFMSWGGIPLDRSATTDTVAQITEWFEVHDKVWVAITPEGTRSRVDRWKTGFLRIAESADVPILVVTWDYSSKRLVFDQCFRGSGDHGADAEMLREYLNCKYTARHPEKQ